MPTIRICRTPDDVTVALHAFRMAWRDLNAVTACDAPVGVFNAPFDCWTVEVQARRLGLPSFNFDMRKYGSRNVVDMMRELECEGVCQVLSRSQKAMAAIVGIPVEDDCDGGQIADLYAKGDFDAIAAHNRSDVETLAALWRFWFPRRAGICLDVETVAREDVAAFRPYIKPDGRVTDPKKIEASIDEKLRKAALDPWLNRIVCIGYEVVGVDLPVLPVTEVAF
jgi:hypothetical protein